MPLPEKSHPNLYEAVGNAAIEKQHELESQHVANTLWTDATAGQVDASFFSSMAPAVKALMSKINDQNLANIAWSYAVVDVDSRSIDDIEMNLEVTTAKSKNLRSLLG